MKKNTYTDEERKKIAAKIKNINKSEALDEFFKLRQYKATGRSSNIGNKCVDYFTFVERLDTIGKKGLSYYDVVANIDNILLNVPSCGRFIIYQSFINDCEEHVIYSYKRLNFSSINSFKPSIAAEIYDNFKPTSILDPFAGWGGRAIAAMSRDINYTGFDTNKRLMRAYFDMIKMLQPHTLSRTEIYFKDAMEIDCNVLRDYDMVFTSPPYYNYEVYHGMQRKTVAEWNKFYKIIFERSWRHLQIGGHYVLNINKEIYETAAVPILGECHQKQQLKIAQRSKESKYQEYIYIWRKIEANIPTYLSSKSSQDLAIPTPAAAATSRICGIQ